MNLQVRDTSSPKRNPQTKERLGVCCSTGVGECFVRSVVRKASGTSGQGGRDSGEGTVCAWRCWGLRSTEGLSWGPGAAACPSPDRLPQSSGHSHLCVTQVSTESLPTGAIPLHLPCPACCAVCVETSPERSGPFLASCPSPSLPSFPQSTSSPSLPGSPSQERTPHLIPGKKGRAPRCVPLPPGALVKFPGRNRTNRI